MKESVLISRAKEYIHSVVGKKLALEERKNIAISLTATILEEAQRIQTSAEKKLQEELAGMMRDPIGKVFTTTMTDECFRSHLSKRVADQLVHVIKTLGIPTYLPRSKKILLWLFGWFGKKFSILAVPLTKRQLRKTTETVILPGEEKPLAHHMKQREKEGVRVNLNRLGEAILGEEEARRRLQTYLQDLAKPGVEYISIKISTLLSQINLLSWEETLDLLAERLRVLYRAAMATYYKRPDGSFVPKFVNLDMEEYRDLALTVALFRKVLDEPEFFQYQAGIVLQSYLPDSYPIQQELTIWAMQRCMQGGAPIKIRIVKGANLAMEQFEASLRLWPVAPYTSKPDVDANYKRMVTYGCRKEHAKAAHLGIGSHNLFDISYAMLLRVENDVVPYVCFEMLEGMSDHIRRVVQKLSGDMLLYCPAATKEEFQNAIAYLVRRLDENTAPENFLTSIFDLTPGSSSWNEQQKFFSDACFAADRVSYSPRRVQNRLVKQPQVYLDHFQNDADTDWSLRQNRIWGAEILSTFKEKTYPPVPLVIGGKEIHNTAESSGIGKGEDPSYPGKTLYHYSLATDKQIQEAIENAKKSESQWSRSSIEQRMLLLGSAAQELRNHRGELIGVMMADAGKTMSEADVEITEAIDFAEYYRINLKEWHNLPDIAWKAKGTVLVTPPWNFPCSIPAGGILAALAAGNCVIFKPAREAVLVGWHLVQILWKGGFSRDVLQFIACEDEPQGSLLIKDPRIASVVLTGATTTAKHFNQMRPGLDLLAETGGKNCMVITDMCDRDLAIKDLVQSAFGHSGQKCSACSLAILEGPVYDDSHFMEHLRDATASLSVGSPWNLKTKINPLIHAPNEALLRGLTKLEPGEEWLLEPKQDLQNPNLWSPGIKLGVTPSSFTFAQELFGPVLGLVRADSVSHAFALMNQTPYGLTAGIHSLDEREQNSWLEQVEAGNCYINRTITGAVVERQPFGGCKESSFGKGAKAGGPNYLASLMEAKQIDLPTEQRVLPKDLLLLRSNVEKKLSPCEIPFWNSSLGSYTFYWEEYFSKSHDPALVLGQDNLQCYKPHPELLLRGQNGDSLLDLCRIIAAAIICKANIIISLETKALFDECKALGIDAIFSIAYEPDEAFMKRIEEKEHKRVRLLHLPNRDVLQVLANISCNLNVGPVMANGRLELLHYLREVSISRDYHRYGNLGAREKEKRTKVL